MFRPLSSGTRIPPTCPTKMPMLWLLGGVIATGSGIVSTLATNNKRQINTGIYLSFKPTLKPEEVTPPTTIYFLKGQCTHLTALGIKCQGKSCHFQKFSGCAGRLFGGSLARATSLAGYPNSKKFPGRSFSGETWTMVFIPAEEFGDREFCEVGVKVNAYSEVPPQAARNRFGSLP